MILTHLVMLRFFEGAGAAASVAATGPLCFQAVQVVSPWVREVQSLSPWVETAQATSPWVEEFQEGCNG